ncbi:7276_t:CDS:2 [Ambispora gerdemannii]|uniref:7276_t:CDS:1 n=1 Tax=Ambispora gerdemannii TaxID=144530 RepID=A0A9N9CMD6_9GLOM|nr:7276_t:CDS:2 [Ambispora gerdemannii]
MSKYTGNLIKDLTELLENSDEYNITILAGENDNLKKFQAHSFILRARSPYFRRALSKVWAKKEGEMMVFKKPNISPQIFKLILKYLYTSMIDLDEESGDDVLGLLIAADELEIHELIYDAQDNLIKQKFTWIQQNFATVMHTASLHEFKRLNEHCLKVIDEEPSTNQPVSNWTLEGFAALEKTLHQCIPLIRYSDISSNDYFEKVRPYRKIIPKDIKTEILSYYLKNSTPQPIKVLSPRSGSVDSKIIDPKQANLISSWIDKKDNIDSFNQYHKSQYKFKLLYRGSRDGFEATKFRELCGSQTGTVVVVKINQTGKIIGGYNPSNWGGNISNNLNLDENTIITRRRFERRIARRTYINAPNAFIFSFDDKSNLLSAKISRNDIGNQIAYNLYQANHGPYFNDDLYISDKCNQNMSSWYQYSYYSTQGLWDKTVRATFDLPDQHTFKVDEYEVFQISKKRLGEVKEQF